ncbi:MAG: hypothetical protein A7316_03690 [Candidatus Altiarchaeales archaeon WOR_SM1_86-2]|nr:MAG: hypothetical protein A7316_03690 [Candidatus Altiarchaeales archaeon WOR_SM1_86-2]ODS36108.1 MAG: hypothetical protein A7315_14420 [Candidatus Altiarchaeales archaeon WOR_SM1_79]
MDKDLELEIKRNLFHLFLGVGIAISVCLSKPLFDWMTAIPFIVASVVMLILPGIKIKAVQEIISNIFYKFERKKDIERFPFKGAIWFAVGVTIPVLFIPPGDVNVVCAIIMVLSVGDSLSTLVGRVYGKHPIGSKSVEGTTAFIISGFIGALVFVDSMLALTFAFVGAAVELIPIIDDNLLIPLFLTILYLFFNLI